MFHILIFLISDKVSRITDFGGTAVAFRLQRKFPHNRNLHIYIYTLVTVKSFVCFYP